MTSTSATATCPPPSTVTTAEHAIMQAAATRFLEHHPRHGGLAPTIADSLHELTQAPATATAPDTAHRDDYHRINGGSGHHLY
ncbi:MAG: hypothetical protein JWM19_5288 [Actinomycetia bacterium]|nr:hypothetical protein [Actinomycetes bacterium]